MLSHQALQQLLVNSTRKHPENAAMEDPGKGTVTYQELDRLSNRLRDRLHLMDVRPGDRVGIYLRKSIDAVASIFGILKTGAAYVPVDPGAPASRNAYILNNCAVKVAIVESRFVSAFTNEIEKLGPVPRLIPLEGSGGGLFLHKALDRQDAPGALAPVVETRVGSPDDLAYILYTSGSTGKPKGVMLSHRNAISFVDWCSEVFEPSPSDRFSSHAPFHFDLSILDIFVSLKHGATLVLIGEDIGKEPNLLAPLIAEKRISIWYSAPSILSLLAQFGNLDRYDYSALRMVLFAGEVFPVKHLRTLHSFWPMPKYFNLYGPTETNVCNFYEVPTPIPAERGEPFPIGRVCSHLRVRAVDSEAGKEVPPGTEGELCVCGPGVMQGYWSLPEQSARAFLEDESGEKWYRTGDIVVGSEDGNYVYVGRRDRMVKRRGYRVEMGEIEATLYRHPEVKEAAVIALADPDGVRLRAFLSCRGQRRPSLIEMKRFCAENLPLYMVPDAVSFQEALPRTSTAKVDYQRLKEMD
ncbi:MAG: amino acid adenylation domain-containing protein [Acidobacteria bacterium]|nr:amino acid adenylation domain-containing protein [Acidobacteriota bacterium]MCI0718256.1 amino acid adenylation domain-containing protein [Acidobacteriota bacterium]